MHIHFILSSVKDKHKHKKQKKRSFDYNMWGVFLHFAGDMLSSLLVLGLGILLKFFDAKWTEYLDPISSLLVVVLILWTTVPLGNPLQSSYRSFFTKVLFTPHSLSYAWIGS